MCLKRFLFVCFVFLVKVHTVKLNLLDEDDDLHSYLEQNKLVFPLPQLRYPQEATATYWNEQAQATLKSHLERKPIINKAKNVIFFMGDGMSIATITASRIYYGQRKLNTTGEETVISFDKMPYTGFSKTYCVNRQVADSACSATAYLCGVKNNDGTIGVTAAVPFKNCNAMQNTNNHVDSIARWSQKRGKMTGFVTTTRVTHASPAGLYAHTADRSWECDTDVLKAGFTPSKCIDIAVQLVHGETGSNLNVIFGGGRQEFIPKWQKDEEGGKGKRSDGRNLINEWKTSKSNFSGAYVYNRTGLLMVPNDTEYVLGLFEKSHTKFNVDRNYDNKPSLTEMTEKAIHLLSKAKEGYFLFVEGGRIDHAHHKSRAHIALDETVELHKALQKALDSTDPQETLIVLTSDHSHTMTINGYPKRGDNILQFGGRAADNLTYSTLSYANGPGYRKERHGLRHNLSKDNLEDYNFKYPGFVPTDQETHAGEDVAIFARGPWAHLFTGVIEQNVIPHFMAFASCVGNGLTACDNPTQKND